MHMEFQYIVTSCLVVFVHLPLLPLYECHFMFVDVGSHVQLVHRHRSAFIGSAVLIDGYAFRPALTQSYLKSKSKGPQKTSQDE